MIDDFAEATWDRNCCPVDVQRARRELPGGHTIAHGLSTLSLVPALGAQIVSIKH
jgi:acyl dehydratase